MIGAAVAGLGSVAEDDDASTSVRSDALFYLAQRKDGPLPVDGILMQLGRTYLEAGKRSDAQQTFNRVVEEYPESPFAGDARREIETLKKSA